MKTKTFYILTALIVILAFSLRVCEYDKVPPVDEAYDEVHYAWGGATWIKEGTPRSWSNFQSYKSYEYIERYGIEWKIVEPLIEKPPLYFLLSGINTLSSQPYDIFNVSHSVIRVLPLVLSVLTVVFTILLGAKVFTYEIGLVSGLLYAVTPTIVLANRMSLTENLLTPLALISALTVISKFSQKATGTLIIAVASALAILTKQIGIFVSLATISVFWTKRQFKDIFILLTISIAAFLVYIAIGFYYDLNLFLALQNDVRLAHTLSGLPETIAAIFRFPTIGPKNHPFLDGTMLLGYILLFSSPIWLNRDRNTRILLTFPFTYLLLLAIGESSQTAFTFFGWYLYPLFPFMIIIVAKFLHNFFKKPDLLVGIFTSLILVSSTIRFLFLLIGRSHQYLWQYALIMIIGIFLLAFATRKKYSKLIFLSLFTFFVLITIAVDINLKELYETTAINDKSLVGF